MKNFLSISVLVCGLNLSAQVFSTPVVMESPLTSGGQSVEFTSQCIVNGKPAIAYYDVSHANLLFVRASDANGTTWNASVTVAHANNVGWFCSMKVSDGFPAIAYVDLTYHVLLFVRALDSNGTAWSNPVIVENSPAYYSGFLSLEIVNGNPAIAFQDGAFDDVKYTRAFDNHGNSWGTPQTLVTSGFVGGSIQMIIVNGNPAITYVDATTGALFYMRANDIFGSSWSIPISIGGTGDMAGEMGFAVTGGKPAVSYENSTTNALKVVVASDVNGTSWQTPQTLDITTGVVRFTSMVNSNGKLMIAYYSPTNNNSRFIRCLDTSGVTWAAPVDINIPNADGYAISLQIINGNPAISLGVQSIAGTLKYVRANDAMGITWGTEVVFNSPRPSGANLSLCVVDDRPAVASSRNSPHQVIYSIATNNSGGTWDSSIVVSTTNPNSYVSMELFSDKPTICFSGSGGNNLRYVRSIDSVGSAWDSPTRVDSTSSVRNCQLLNLNGTPAIAYWDAFGNSILYTHALNPGGTAWAPAITPFTDDSVWFEVAVINGRPAIAYVTSNPSGNTIMFSISSDSLGSSWSTPLAILSINIYDSPPSLANIGGFPAIVYRDPNTYTLGYIRALDSLGTTWGLPIQPDVNGYTGDDPTLVYHDGRPVVSFTGINNERCFIASNDRIGNVWSSTVFVDSIYQPLGSKASDVISINGNVGLGYYQFSDRYGYYTSTCLAPFNPIAASSVLLCSGNTAALTVSGYGSLSWYTSSAGGTYLASGSTFNTGILTNTTTYYVQDSTCAASTRTAVTVTVNPLPTISLSGTTQICSGDSTTLAVSGNGDGFEWSTGSLNMSESFVPASTTNYWVTTYDGAGCVDTFFFVVSVTQPQTTTQTIALCDGESYTVGSNSYSTAGTYTDSLSTLQLGCDSVVVTTITVQPIIDTTVNYSSGILSSNESGATYQWINCTTQQPVNGAMNQNFTPIQNGTYAVAIVNGPCVDTSVCYTVTDVGIDEIVSNPAALVVTSVSGQISAVVQTGTGSVTYEFYNALGEIVFTTSGQVGEVVSYPSRVVGIYIVKATSAGTTMLQRVVVQ